MTSGRFLAGDRRPLQSYRTKGWNSEGTLVRVYAGGVMREATVGVAVPDTGENSVTRAGKAVHRRQALTGPPPRQAGRKGWKNGSTYTAGLRNGRELDTSGGHLQVPSPTPLGLIFL